jgi:integrase
LKKLFGGPIFAISFAERAEPKRHTVETTLAWLIPIALYSGMRLDEICGLRSEDVMDEGTLYFDLRSHVGRRLKTAAAKRRIPIHSELMRIGFEAYLAHVRSHGHEYLFPALKPGGPDGKRSWYVSKRFTTYRRAVGVGASGTVFHCFRKNAATALERARVPENEAVQILGHKKLTMSYGLYSGGLDLAGLARVVAAITYPGLDLTGLSAPLEKPIRQQLPDAPAPTKSHVLDET